MWVRCQDEACALVSPPCLQVRSYAHTFELDPEAYDRINERLRLIERLLRAHGCRFAEQLVEQARLAEKRLEAYYDAEGQQVCQRGGGGSRCARESGGSRCDRVGGGSRCARERRGSRCDRVGGGSRCARERGGSRCARDWGQRLRLSECGRGRGGAEGAERPLMCEEGGLRGR